MIGTFWNSRGLNKLGRIRCVSDFIKMNKLEFVGLQETKKAEFNVNTLRLVDRDTNWNCMPVCRGILVGFKDQSFKILAKQ
jgi:hypothetical protein